MHDALFGRLGERGGDLPHDGKGRLQERRTVAGEPVAQVLPLHVFLHDIVQAVGLAHLVDLHDVGMHQLRGGLGLELESPQVRAVAGQLRPEDLDRHPAFQLRLFGQIDVSHRPLAQPARKRKLPICRPERSPGRRGGSFFCVGSLITYSSGLPNTGSSGPPSSCGEMSLRLGCRGAEVRRRRLVLKTAVVRRDGWLPRRRFGRRPQSCLLRFSCRYGGVLLFFFRLGLFAGWFWSDHIRRIVRVSDCAQARLVRPLGGNINYHQHHARRGRDAAEHYFLGVIGLAFFLGEASAIVGLRGQAFQFIQGTLRRGGRDRWRRSGSNTIADRSRYRKRRGHWRQRSASRRGSPAVTALFAAAGPAASNRAAKEMTVASLGVHIWVPLRTAEVTDFEAFAPQSSAEEGPRPPAPHDGPASLANKSRSWPFAAGPRG